MLTNDEIDKMHVFMKRYVRAEVFESIQTKYTLEDVITAEQDDFTKKYGYTTYTFFYRENYSTSSGVQIDILVAPIAPIYLISQPMNRCAPAVSYLTYHHFVASVRNKYKISYSMALDTKLADILAYDNIQSYIMSSILNGTSVIDELDIIYLTLA